MILIIHHQAKKLSRVRFNDEVLEWKQNDLCQVFWELAEKYPDEIIYWCEEEYLELLDSNAFQEIFPHDLIMASYALKHSYLPEQIGYIDQLPFINVNREVRYGTWRMSTDAGGIKGRSLMKFRQQFDKTKDFGFLINSIAKLGQYNGLFCYSDPRFFQGKLSKKYVPQSSASVSQLFAFVYMYYKTQRVWLLFFCFIRYEQSLPLISLFRCFFCRKSFLKAIDLSGINIKTKRFPSISNSLDVIIPTLGRRDYLLNVLEDLKNQSLLPRKVIVVEQNPNPNSVTELPELKSDSWPFEIVHHFIHKTGACTARNIALEEVNAEWIFFADDDNRMEADVLKRSTEEMMTFGIQCLTLNYIQQRETLFFNKRKQWGAFGAGNSIVQGEFAKKIRFDSAFDHGYGEDIEYGMQLRNAGCDVIYHPNIKILHLKAPRGGFREVSLPPWRQDNPKPAPTVLLYARKYYNSWQLKGFKTELFLRNYDIKKNINPLKYWKNMKLRWAVSEDWAKKLLLR